MSLYHNCTPSAAFRYMQCLALWTTCWLRWHVVVTESFLYRDRTSMHCIQYTAVHRHCEWRARCSHYTNRIVSVPRLYSEVSTCSVHAVLCHSKRHAGYTAVIVQIESFLYTTTLQGHYMQCPYMQCHYMQATQATLQALYVAQTPCAMKLNAIIVK